MTNYANLVIILYINMYREERKKYHLHREKSRAQPTKYITIIIDGMDQSKTNIPALVPEAKSTQKLTRLRTHLTGAIVHTQAPHGKLLYAFYDTMQWPHDSNLTLEVLSRIMHRLKEKLPPTLYLQLDNCGRENKNRYFFGFCSLLVAKGIFKKVHTIHIPYCFL